jgi:hypothetical protein
MLELVKPFNFITAVDSYKLSHWEQIPENATHAVSLIVPRNGPNLHSPHSCYRSY